MFAYLRGRIGGHFSLLSVFFATSDNVKRMKGHLVTFCLKLIVQLCFSRVPI